MLNGPIVALTLFPASAARGILEKCDPPAMTPSLATSSAVFPVR